MRTLSKHLRAFFSSEVIQGILYFLLFIGLSSLLAYGFFVDHETVFNILLGVIVIGMWLILSFILLGVGLMKFIEDDWDEKLTGLFVGALGTISFGGLISACLHFFL